MDEVGEENPEDGLSTRARRRWRLPLLLTSDVWHNADFVRLWVGQTISSFGSQITFLALPLTAVLTLDAPPLQLGVLVAVEYVPGLALGLVAGALVDRFSKGRIMVATNAARALLLGLIPVLAATGHLRIGYLYVIGFAVGVFTIAFDVAYISVVPEIVRREKLVEANSNITASQSVAIVAGPPVAGVLVSLLDPPNAIAVDAASFAVAAALFTAMSVTRGGRRPPTPLCGSPGGPGAPAKRPRPTSSRRSSPTSRKAWCSCAAAGRFVRSPARPRP
jgi:MFS family permease